MIATDQQAVPSRMRRLPNALPAAGIEVCVGDYLPAIEIASERSRAAFPISAMGSSA